MPWCTLTLSIKITQTFKSWLPRAAAGCGRHLFCVCIRCDELVMTWDWLDRRAPHCQNTRSPRRPILRLQWIQSLNPDWTRKPINRESRRHSTNSLPFDFDVIRYLGAAFSWWSGDHSTFYRCCCRYAILLWQDQRWEFSCDAHCELRMLLTSSPRVPCNSSSFLVMQPPCEGAISWAVASMRHDEAGALSLFLSRCRSKGKTTVYPPGIEIAYTQYLTKLYLYCAELKAT